MRPPLALPPEPAWIARSVAAVLHRAHSLMDTAGPRDLVRLTSELLGGELHRLASNDHLDLWIDLWFSQLVSAAATRSRRWGGGAGVGRPAWWLLHGLAAIDSSSANAAAVLDKVTAHVPLRVRRAEPDWLVTVPEITATGEMWLTRDIYGDRFAVFAGFCFPPDDSFVFLFDVDGSGLVDLAGAGMYDDTDQAVRAWRSVVGAGAGIEWPHAVVDPAELRCLVQCDLARRTPAGVESRATLDNWFPAARRFIDVADALRAQGDELPARVSLFDDIDPSRLVAEFVDWFEAHHAGPIDLAAVDALAVEWIEGSLPETVHSISPARVIFKRDMLDDWIADDSITIAAKELFGIWVRWHGLRAGLPEPLIAGSVEAARRPWHR